MPCEMCSWLQASVHQPSQFMLLPLLPNAQKRGKFPPPGHCHTDGALPDLFITDHTYKYLHAHKTGMNACASTFTEKHNTDTQAQTWSVALCPIEFAGPVAEHNEVFTLRHSS